MKISLCTQTCDRNDFLNKALPSWLDYSCDEIVIFDWPVSEDALSIVKNYTDSRIKLLQYEGDDPYNTMIAKNTAMRATSNDLILYIDSDVLINHGFNQFQPTSDTFVQMAIADESTLPEDIRSNTEGGLINGPLTGSILLTREQFIRSNGCNEAMSGWGHDDWDLGNRLISLGYKRDFWPNGMLKHIWHGDDLRTKNFIIKDKWNSQKNNATIALIDPWDINKQQTRIKVVCYSERSPHFLTEI